jgi:hypothetical protein
MSVMISKREKEPLTERLSLRVSKRERETIRCYADVSAVSEGEAIRMLIKRFLNPEPECLV